MPGIYGLITGKNCESAEIEFSIMSEAFTREYFYSSGSYINRELGVYVGWTCLKDSFSDCMPVFNEKKDVVLVYYGEDYRDSAEIVELKGKNHVFNKVNASYIVHMYEEWGESFLVMLNGRFHGLLIDTRKNKTILFNDRYAARRTNYYKDNDSFYFSAEANALINVCPHLRQLDMASLAELFIYNCVRGDKTLFTNISLLPGASAYMFSNGQGVEQRRYFEPSELESQPLLEKEFFYEKFRHTFLKVVQRYVRTERNIGVDLPGTLDSSIILANLQCSPDRYHFYFSDNDLDEVHDMADARRIATAFEQQLNEYSLDDEFTACFPSFAEKAVYLSDGTMNITGAESYYLNQSLAKQTRTKLSATYGSAVLRNFVKIYSHSVDKQYFKADFQNILSTKLLNFNTSTIKSNKADIHHDNVTLNHGLMAIDEYQFMVKTPYLDNELVKLMFRAPDEVTGNLDLSLRLLIDGNCSLAAVENDKLKRNLILNPTQGLFSHLCSRLLKATGRYFSDSGMNVICNDSKNLHNNIGTGSALFLPQSTMYRNRVSGYIKELLLDTRSASRDHIAKSHLEKAVLEYANGSGGITQEICLLATAELFSRLFIDVK